MTYLIVGIILFLIAIGINVSLKKELAKDPKVDFGPTLPILKGAMVLGLFIAFSSTFTIINPGEVGILVTFGHVDPVPLDANFHFVKPWSNIYRMPIQVQKDTEVQQSETSDTQSVSIGTMYNWRPISANMPKLFEQFGIDYAAKLIPLANKESVKAEIAKYKVTEIVNSRPKIHAAIQQVVNDWLSKYGIEVLEFSITDIDFSDKYDAAIEAKQIQEQSALQKKYELERTQIEAQMAAAVAEGESKSKIAKAQGDAESVKLAALAESEALKTRADAQAEYNKKVAESLTNSFIQYELLKKWNGTLPTFVTGESNPMMLLNIDKK